MKKIYILMIAVLLGGIAKGQISLIPNLSPSDSGFTDNPVVYNNNLYFQYINDSGKSHLAKYDGNNITLIPNMNTNDNGISGKVAEYNGLLYMIYENDNGKKYLAEYNGNNLSIKPNLNISDYGIEGNPFEYNGNLYFPYKNTSEKIQLAKYNGTTISLVNNLNNNDYGCIWSPMIYNNKLFFGYRDNTNHNYLANYDGSILNIIPNPDTTMFSGFQYNLKVFKNKLYFCYNRHDANCSYHCDQLILTEYDGNIFKTIDYTTYSFWGEIIYDSCLLFGTDSHSANWGNSYYLQKYDGNTSSYVDLGGSSYYNSNDYYGEPFIYNNSLILKILTGYGVKLGKYSNNTLNILQNPDATNYGFFGSSAVFNNRLYNCYTEFNQNNVLTRYDGTPIIKFPNLSIIDKGVMGNMIVFNNNLYFKYQNGYNKFQLAKYTDIVNTSLPYIFNVNSGGTYYSCMPGTKVSTNGSQLGVTYYLYRNNILIDSLEGTAHSLEWDSLTTGIYTVKGKNNIGTVNMSGYASISVADYYPTSATTLTGLVNACTGSTNVTYTVNPISNIFGYIWRLPNGKLDTTLTNTISVNFDTNTVATYISVRGYSCLATGDSTFLNIKINQMPGIAGIISGADTVCGYNVHEIYVIPQIANATNYIWTFPENTWGYGDTSLSLYLNIQSKSGYITVRASNCMGQGDSSYMFVYVTPLPEKAGSISGPNSAYPGQTNLLYSVPQIQGVKKYIWNLPLGFNGSSDSNSIIVNIDSNIHNGGNISVMGRNDCLTGDSSFINVYVPNGKWQNTFLLDGSGNLSKSDSNILVGNSSQILLTKDNGKSWTTLNTNIYNYLNYSTGFAIKDSIIILAMDHSNSSSDIYHLYKSKNYGMNWAKFENGLDTVSEKRFIIGGDKILISDKYNYNNNKLYYSKFNDTNWVNITNGLPSNSIIYPLAIDGDNLYVGNDNSNTSNDYRIYKSANNGASWSLINNGFFNTRVNALHINGDTLIAATSKGVFASVNGGGIWYSISNGIEYLNVNCLKVLNNKIFIGTSFNGVYVSSDFGTNWCPINEGLTSLYIYSLEIIDSRINAITQYGLWRRDLTDFASVKGTNDSIIGTDIVCQGQNNVSYSVSMPNNSKYIWSLPEGVSGISDSNFIYVNFDVSFESGYINVRKQGDSIYYSKFIKVYKLPKVTTVNNFAFEKFTEKDGLCNNQVFCMAMDNQGNKWFGTALGISKFDGVNWTSYYNYAGNNIIHVRKIVVDLQGVLWFVVSNGILKYDGINWSFYNSLSYGILNDYFYTIAVDNLNNKWFGTSRGLVKYDNQSWDYYDPSPNGYYTSVSSIAIDNQNRKWLSTYGKGLIMYDDINWTVYNQNTGYAFNNFINDIKIDSLDNKWLTSSSGIDKFDGVNISHYQGFEGWELNVFVDNQNNKWFTGGIDMYYYDNNTFVTNCQFNYIRGIAIDNLNNIWLCSNEGVYKLNKINKISGTDSICQGQNNIFYSIPEIAYATSYIWQLPSGVIGLSSTNSITVNFTNTAQSGNISVIAQNNCGNSDTINFPIVVQNCTGINEINKSISNLKIYPNPATNTLTLNLSQLKQLQNAIVGIYDIQGKQLLQQNITELQTQIDISSFAKGIYIVKLQTDKETLQNKFIKE